MNVWFEFYYDELTYDKYLARCIIQYECFFLCCYTYFICRCRCRIPSNHAINKLNENASNTLSYLYNLCLNDYILSQNLDTKSNEILCKPIDDTVYGQCLRKYSLPRDFKADIVFSLTFYIDHCCALSGVYIANLLHLSPS